MVDSLGVEGGDGFSGAGVGDGCGVGLSSGIVIPHG